MFHFEDEKKFVVNIPRLADDLEKKPVERRLPNGAVVSQISWTGDDLIKINEVYRNTGEFVSSKGKYVLIDGAGPAFLFTSITHACHPASVSISDPKVVEKEVPVKPIRTVPAEEADNKDVKYEIYKGDNFYLLRTEITSPGGVMDHQKMDNIRSPDILGKPVVISGRLPHWFTVSLANTYAHKVPWVACHQPGTGATVSISHNPDVKLGTIIPNEKITNVLCEQFHGAEKLNSHNPERSLSEDSNVASRAEARIETKMRLRLSL